MIAPRADANLRAEDSRRVPVGNEPTPDRSSRFADLLSAGQIPQPAVEAAGGASVGEFAGAHAVVGDGHAGSPGASGVLSSDVAVQIDAAPPTAEALVFNQYGFFATQAVVTPDSAIAFATEQPDPVAVAIRGATPVGSTPSSFAEGHDTALLKTGPAALTTQAVAIRLLRPGTARSLPVIPACMSQARTASTATSIPVGEADRARPMPPRRAVSQGASVAVAVHAGTTGVDVAAQVAGLDERERARLADEIAAMLSMHGYAPAQVTITAVAARAARQEHR